MHTPMLVQASKVYTPPIFEAFQSEYERSMAACTRVSDDNNKFAVAIGRLHGNLTFEEEEEHIVIGDHLNQTASCSCQMFNRAGILCGHSLKVLDLMNVKTLPPHYILKRWTRGARNGSIQDRHGRKVVENPKLEAQLRYKDMSHKFHNLASKIANSPECCFLLEDALDRLGPELEDKLKELATNAKNGSSNGQDQENVDPNVQQANDLLRSAKLKKKEVSSKNLRRKQNWFDKLRKGRKPMKVVAPTQKGAKVSCLCNMSWLFIPKLTS
jgi:zinc finger SWIM domain-containing protein 3